jgi:hypothetical protein
VLALCKNGARLGRSPLAKDDYHSPPQFLDISNDLDENNKIDEKLSELLAKNHSLVSQIICTELYFSRAAMRREMFDRDFLLLQECATMCDALAAHVLPQVRDN